MTYTLMNLAFAAVAGAFAAFALRGVRVSTLGWTLVWLTVLTVIGDNFIVASGIVAYSSEKISGILVGVAPIEDFFYALIAALLVPSVWLLLGKSKKGEVSQ
jgi:lycopene cyclase domain-containing protein